MALEISDYVLVKNESNLKIHKNDNKKFIFDFRIDGKRYRKVCKFTNCGWDKKTYIKEAKKELQQYKEDIEAGYNLSKNITLDKLFELQSKDFDYTKEWANNKVLIYKRYIIKTIGNKKIETIRHMDVKSVLTKMSEDGLSPRTQKRVLEILKPLFKFAIINKYLKENPIIDLTVKIPNQKKIVTNATTLFNQVHKGILEYFKDKPFYKALFLFGLTGRRKNEILTLKWENIDLKNMYYWITSADVKNDENQKYPIPQMVIEPLLQIKDDRKGFVFKSPVTGKQIVDIDRQMHHLRKHIGVENLTLHYMRNILVSMLAEQQTEAIVLSGILGHKDVNTINKYLSINHYKSGQEGLKKIDKIIDVDVIDK